MPSASLESTLELWSTTLRQTKQRIRPLFAAPSVAASANAFLDGLLGGERRNTGWMRAEAAGDPGPWRQQAILGRTHWDAEALRDVVRDDVVETLASPDAVLVIDETGFLKQGKASCGVGRQYSPWTNGQVERMNRTIKDATVKRYHYASHDERRHHLQLFVDAYNYGRRLKTLRGLTPYEFICQTWTKEPERFRLNPSHHMPGRNI